MPGVTNRTVAAIEFNRTSSNPIERRGSIELGNRTQSNTHKKISQSNKFEQFAFLSDFKYVRLGSISFDLGSVIDPQSNSHKKFGFDCVRRRSIRFDEVRLNSIAEPFD